MGGCPTGPRTSTRDGAPCARPRRPSTVAPPRPADVPRPLDGADRGRRPADPHRPGAARGVRPGATPGAGGAARAVPGPRRRVHQPRPSRPPRPAVPAPHPGQADGHRPARLPALWRAGGPRPGRGGRARRQADDRPGPVRGAARRALGTPRAARADRPGDRLPDRGVAHRLLPRRHRPVPGDGRAGGAARRRHAPGLGGARRSGRATSTRCAPPRSRPSSARA